MSAYQARYPIATMCRLLEVSPSGYYGTQYTAVAFGKRCREAGVRPSMGSRGDCYDNALCESFFATLECELLERGRFANHQEARRALFEFIEGGYNRHRRHSALDYDSPANYERRHFVHRNGTSSVRETDGAVGNGDCDSCPGAQIPSPIGVTAACVAEDPSGRLSTEAG